MPVNRRTAMSIGLSAAVSPVAFNATPSLAQVRPPAGRPAQVAGVYRLRIGDHLVTVLLDGHVDVSLDLFRGASTEAVQQLLSAGFVAADKLRVGVAAYLVESAGRRVLVDAGSSEIFGPTVGRLPRNLEMAGVVPAEIDTVLLTHFHPDHAWGLLTGGKPLFPNATLALHEAELAFWTSTDAAGRAPEFQKPWFAAARRVRDAYAKTILHAGTGDVAPGITALALPGHTPGHTGYLVASGRDQMMIVGDLVTSSNYSFERPDIGLAFDVDHDAAAKTRRNALDRIATDRLLIAGTHLPFPTLGHVAREQTAYRFVPAEWRHEL